MRTLSLPTWLGGLTYYADNEGMTGWITNVASALQLPGRELYEQRFVVRMPEITEEDRDTTIEQVAETYVAAIPEDPLIMRY